MWHSGFWLGEIWWYYEIGSSIVAVMACQEPSLKPVARPGLSFAFSPQSSPTQHILIEWEIKRHIKNRWPNMADLRRRSKRRLATYQTKLS